MLLLLLLHLIDDDPAAAPAVYSASTNPAASATTPVAPASPADNHATEVDQCNHRTTLLEALASSNTRTLQTSKDKAKTFQPG